MNAPIASAILLCLGAVPLWAGGEAAPAPGDTERGLGLMQQGSRLILRGLLSEMEPQMRTLVRDLAVLMDNLDAYEMPEMLPNGDIIIRRKVPLVPTPPGAEGNDIDL